MDRGLGTVTLFVLAMSVAWLAVESGQDGPPALVTVPRDGPPPALLLPDPRTNPSWAIRPSPMFPDQAYAAGISSGRVRLRCVTTETGVFADCQILEEAPQGYGFGQAALEAASRARLTPRTVNGAPASSTITFGIQFEIG